MRPARTIAVVSDHAPTLAQELAQRHSGGREWRYRTLPDAVALGRFLRREGEFAEEPGAPALVLLDLPEPLAALRTVKRDPRSRALPVVVLSHAADAGPERALWAEGASSVIPCPATPAERVALLALLGRYWLHHARLP